MKLTQEQIKQRADRRKRLEKAERPYWNECLLCMISCENAIQRGEKRYSIVTCPVFHRAGPMYPYKYAEMMKQREQEEKENGKAKD